MLPSFGHTGCSTQIKMELILIDGTSLPIAQMGPDFLLLHKPVNLPPCEATLVFTVDDNERRRVVLLPNGMSADCERVAIAKSDVNS